MSQIRTFAAFKLAEHIARNVRLAAPPTVATMLPVPLM
jgi:hypothetical protein